MRLQTELKATFCKGSKMHFIRGRKIQQQSGIDIIEVEQMREPFEYVVLCNH